MTQSSAHKALARKLGSLTFTNINGLKTSKYNRGTSFEHEYLSPIKSQHLSETFKATFTNTRDDAAGFPRNGPICLLPHCRKSFCLKVGL